MTVRTKKYQFEPGLFIKMAMRNIMLDLWWVGLIPIALMLLPLLYAPLFWYCFVITLLGVIIYPLFWYAQFLGITRHEQAGIFFEKLSYEIDSRMILMKVSKQKGMPIKWNQVRKVQRKKDATLIYLSKFQFIYLPDHIFNSQHEMKMVETILKRKNFIAA